MDEAAFGAVYAQTAPRLRAYFIATLRDSAVADDLLQEAYIRFIRAELNGANIHQIRSYLYKTALSLIADHGRRNTRRRKFRESWIEREPECPKHGLAIDMKRLFGKLEPKQQTLLWLAYVEGASHREIAASLGMRELGVRVTLFRTRAKLAKILEDHGWNSGESP